MVAGGIMIGLLGWHWSFLPTFAAELIPGLDLIPTWTAAVFLVTRQKTAAVEQKAPGAPRTPPGEPDILPPSPGRRAYPGLSRRMYADRPPPSSPPHRVD